MRMPYDILAEAQLKSPPKSIDRELFHEGPYGTFEVSMEEYAIIVCTQGSASEMVRNRKEGTQYHHTLRFGGYNFKTTSNRVIGYLDMMKMASGK